jgi:hypothetical protein
MYRDWPLHGPILSGEDGMYGNNFHAPRVDVHQFSMIPRSDIPRSTFRMQSQHKTTIGASYLYPVMVQEVLPGDTFNGSMTAFIRMATPIYPIMDNLELESWFFFVPARIVWNHWINFMGEQPASPSDSISYVIPTITSPVGGFVTTSIYDFMGIPGAGQLTAGNTITINALPFRAYNMIWNQWFRDENLQNAVGYGAANTVYDIGDGPDPYTNYGIQRTAKRHDYFTSCLPWTQKGATPITLPLGTSAPIKTSVAEQVSTGAVSSVTWRNITGAGLGTAGTISTSAGTPAPTFLGNTAPGTTLGNIYPTNLYADLSAATAATINQIRLAFQTQRLLERDARGGTRYQELLMSHFGVRPLDARLQRPEYLGGGRSAVNIAPVPQTSGTSASGTTSPLGTLSAVGTATARGHGFRQSFTEHGYILGLVAVRADQIYQQGLHRMWTRSTRYDFYWPVFAMLGEQGVRNDEIYCVGNPTQDTTIFGYQERWAEYRYMPSRTSAYFRSTATAPLDAWHTAVKFNTLPALNSSFIGDPTYTTLQRNLAGGASVADEEFLCDFFFDIKCARPMPMYSVPGMLDHF